MVKKIYSSRNEFLEIQKLIFEEEENNFKYDMYFKLCVILGLALLCFVYGFKFMGLL